MPAQPLSEVRVFAPATVANVVCGYDVLGLAIDSPGDEIWVRRSQTSGLKIVKITGDQGKLPICLEKNTAGVAATALLKKLEQTHLGIEMEIHKKMPIGSGLGSSAASSVAAVYAINTLLGSPLSKADLLPFCVEGEVAADGSYHADNVAPCLLGGLVLVSETHPLKIVPVPVKNPLWLSVIYPEIEILTRDARAIIPESIPLSLVTQQMSYLASFVLAVTQGDNALIASSMKDLLVQPHREINIPRFNDARQLSMESAALGFGISGAGPSLFALSKDQATAQQIAENIYQLYHHESQMGCQYFVSRINQKGVTTLHTS